MRFLKLSISSIVELLTASERRDPPSFVSSDWLADAFAALTQKRRIKHRQHP